MVTVLVLFGLAVLGGSVLTALWLMHKTLPIPLAALHGVFVLAGVILLVVLILTRGPAWAPLTALVLFCVTLAAGTLLFIDLLSGRELQLSLVLVHGIMETAAFLIFLAVVLGGVSAGWNRPGEVQNTNGGVKMENGIAEGSPAPDFTLPSSTGKEIALKGLKGKNVVLYFYPKDDTPGCTTEACEFRDSIKEMEGLDTVVLGVSLDDLTSHQKFISKYGLSFPLLYDKDGAMGKTYGVESMFKIMGRTILGFKRTTFIIDRNGIIVKIYQNVNPKGHSEEVLDFLKTMKK